MTHVLFFSSFLKQYEGKRQNAEFFQRSSAKIPERCKIGASWKEGV